MQYGIEREKLQYNNEGEELQYNNNGEYAYYPVLGPGDDPLQTFLPFFHAHPVNRPALLACAFPDSAILTTILNLTVPPPLLDKYVFLGVVLLHRHDCVQRVLAARASPLRHCLVRHVLRHNLCGDVRALLEDMAVCTPAMLRVYADMLPGIVRDAEAVLVVAQRQNVRHRNRVSMYALYRKLRK